MPDLIDWIEEQMANDDEDRVKQSRKLRELYEDCAPAQRRAMDDALICICGYSIASALERCSDEPE